MNTIRTIALTCVLVLIGPGAFAQDKGTLAPRPLPSLTNPEDPALPAKELFGRSTTPASLRARAIGSYARGCVAGATAIPIDGANWQVMT